MYGTAYYRLILFTEDNGGDYYYNFYTQVNYSKINFPLYTKKENIHEMNYWLKDMSGQ